MHRAEGAHRRRAGLPGPGILFRDIAPLLRDHFAAAIAALERLYSEAEWRGVDARSPASRRAASSSAAALAQRRGKGFVPIRKQGKLPPPVVELAYELEYGSGVLEMQPGAGRVLIVDDVLATGGTLHAAAELCARAGWRGPGAGGADRPEARPASSAGAACRCATAHGLCLRPCRRGWW